MFSPSTLFIYPEKKPVDRERCFSTAGTFLYVLTILLGFFFPTLVVLPEWEAPLGIVNPVSPRGWLVGTFDVNDAIYFSILVD